MDRTLLDKLESNVNSLKGELDNCYLNGLTPEVQALIARICELAGGHSAESSQKTILAMRKSLETRRVLNGELQEANALLRRRNNTLAAEIEAMKRRLVAAEALAPAYKDGAKFIAKYAADTGSVLAQRALDRMEAALRQYRETSDA